MIKRFEYTYELAWKTLQDLLKEKGYSDIAGPRPVIEQCLEDGILGNGEVWMRMIKSRNLTAHVYDEKTVDEIAEIIRSEPLGCCLKSIIVAIVSLRASKFLLKKDSKPIFSSASALLFCLLFFGKFCVKISFISSKTALSMPCFI